MPVLCRRMSKRTVWALSLAGAIAAQVVLHFERGAAATPVVLATWGFGFLASGIALAMPFSVLSDSVDYGEWRCGVRAEGLLTAIGAAFCLKAGSGLGGALPAWIMAHYSYIPNAAQTPRSLFGIVLSCIWAPAAAYALAAIPVFFYGCYERQEATVQSELAARWRGLEAAARL